MGSYRFKEDEVVKISTSVFVANFRDSFGAKDLWNTCKQYGHVVDAYIPYRRSKAGKRFGFVRFIKVLDVDRLVNNLCTVKDFATLANLKVVVANEGFDNINFKYMGGYWVMMEFQTEVIKLKFQENSVMKTWFSQIQFASSNFNTVGRVTRVEIEGITLKMWSKNTFNRVASKCDVLLDVDDQEDEHFHRKRICINTNVPTNIFESFKLIDRGKVFWVKAKEVPGWIPDFVEDNDEEEDSEVGSYEEVPNGEDVKNVEDLEGDSDGEIVPDSKFEEDFPNQKSEEDSVGQVNVQSEDPFNIYELLNHKRPVIDNNSNSKESLKYPPGYTPTGSHFKKSEVPKSGGFILQLIDDLVKVGKTISASVGNSGEIMCVWDPNMFKNTNSTEKKMLWDYLSLVMSKWEGEVVIMGDFNEVRNKSERFGTLFNRHGADVFNRFISNARLEEVPSEGCSFTWCHRSATKMSKLDNFLISDSLLCSCPNISSITLDRYLSDHRPILMREVYYDYGPVPFRLFHYWFEVDSFDKFIEDSWKDAPIIESNALIRMMKKLKYLKEKIRMWNKSNKEKSHKSKRSLLVELANCDAIIDKGEGENNVVNRITEVVKLLQKVEKKDSLETAQKAKIKWGIKGDENSKYYHGVINKKRNQLSIRGILVEGTCIDSSSLVKSEFLSHFKNRFEQSNSNRLHMNMHFSNTLSYVQVADLECQVSKEEIQRRCGIDKSPGPDGFTFGFYHRYWKLIENDVVDAMTCFFHQGSFPKGGSKLGGCMSRIQSWNETIKRMTCRLSKWKLKTLLIGGRLTLHKSVQGSMPIYHMSLFKVPKKVLHHKCGLGVSSLFAFNRALMFKWVWHFITQGSSLWARVIKALHGYDGKIGQKVKSCYPSLWLYIIHEVEMFKSRGIDLVSLIHSKLGNGANTSFWEVAWHGGSPFKSLFPRLYVLETQKKIDVASKLSHSDLDVSFRRPPRGGVEIQQFEHMKKKVEGCILADMMDIWCWALEGSGEFTITSVRKMIDDFMLPEVSSKMRWIKAVPIKVNMHAWKVKLDGLPTRLNISRRGNDVTNHDAFFRNNIDCTGREGIFALLKCTSAIRQLEYDVNADFLDE
uniref:RNA-directed DNA polymerase, eukaryota, reverse transcriptase zinc-binding domain protein n=1 Tax=Tanacetum cinerariifolium TaxID=118510 RepID=A0A6L2JA04_TANCI|nr:RNA-directed DNA polymerase, eukaryota, reverse transcriptase zinc-binding domain protein [Tanacetum cinerariifolium]